MALSRREKLKLLVKVKLDELSPFDNLKGDESVEGFIAAGGDTDYDQVNPISSYIEKTIDSSAEYCLRDLPEPMLSKDVVKDKKDVSINGSGVGVISDYGYNYRLVRLSMLGGELGRDITHFISPSNAQYVLQQSKYTRGGFTKPVAVYSPETNSVEVYSFDNGLYNTVKKANVYRIKLDTVAEGVASSIDDFIALRCAAYVLEIIGDGERAGVLMTEYENKKKVI